MKQIDLHYVDIILHNIDSIKKISVKFMKWMADKFEH